MAMVVVANEDDDGSDYHNSFITRKMKIDKSFITNKDNHNRE